MSRKIRDLVEVRSRPTVVRLEHLEAADASWISSSYHLTEAVRAHVHSLRHLLAQEHGCGIFIIGHFGSGKSHLLAWITQQVRSGALAGDPAGSLEVRTLSLLNYRAEVTLEQAVVEALGLETGPEDRRRAWAGLDRSGAGTLLLIDELSEFLRSKPSLRGFNEDVRFLQFMGEWAQSHRLWVVAAMQEQIEHTGALESSLYRKIKDRFPVRYLLTIEHVRDLISESILIKRPGYEAATEGLARDIRQALPDAELDLDAMMQLYPIHPVTIEMLEEVRDLFSQTRGVVDFVSTRLAGDPARGVEPFLDRAWGELLTPETIIDHFADLFEVQPEFLGLAQRLLPYYRKHLGELFTTPAQQELAWRLLKLLMLAHVSPQRSGIAVADAVAWLLVRATSIAPARNLQIVERILRTLATEGRHVRESDGRFQLDLDDDSAEQVERRLQRELAELADVSEDAVWEILVPALEGSELNPFLLPRDTWTRRRVGWHLHEREYSVRLGNGEVPRRDRGADTAGGLALCIRLPWGDADPAPGIATVVPSRLELEPQLRELAALLRMAASPRDEGLRELIEHRIAERKGLLVAQVRGAYLQATIHDQDGGTETLRGPSVAGGTRAWLDAHAIWLLRRTYPGFERFAPAHGPLPKDAYRQLMKVLEEHDLGDAEGDEQVRLIREAYLVPMGLMKREGWYYRTVPKLDRHDLVKLVTPVLEHRPQPAVVYEHLAGPIYGLVPDQVHLLLIFLLLEGELDITKAGRSYRELYDTMPLPIQYDRIEPGRGLSVEQLKALQELCAVLEVRSARQWTVTAQRQAVRKIREAGRALCGRLQPVLLRLEQVDPEVAVATKLRRLLKAWSALDASQDELVCFEQLLYEVGSASRLAGWVRELGDLPERLGGLLAELRRFAHLLTEPVLVSWDEPVIRTRLEALGRQPGLDDLAVVEQWLQQARATYDAYCADYRRRHDEWWSGVHAVEALAWQPPAVAGSRHLGLDEVLAELGRAREQARSKLCSRLTDLEYRPQCACGFDGRGAPVEEQLSALAAARERIESEVGRFFRQESVREQVRTLVEDGLEATPATREYARGGRDLPEIENVDLLDRHLAGLRLIREVPAEPVLELLGERVWQVPPLLEALGELLAPHGEVRLRFVKPDSAGPGQVPQELAQWCIDQALEHGACLPVRLPDHALAAAADRVRDETIGREALERLETLGLGPAVEDHVLGRIVAGAVRVEGLATATPLVRAATELVRPSEPRDAADLARLAACLYRAHPRLARIGGAGWLARLDQLAGSQLQPSPEPLPQALRARLEAQWLIIDCLGLPLLEVLDEAVTEVLHAWPIRTLGFATVGPTTTTDAYFRSLAEEGINHPLEKVNAVDRLLHERMLGLADLEPLVRAELTVALRAAARRLDPARPLLILSDHGFRLDPAGRRYVHGGPSTLERTVPLLELAP